MATTKKSTALAVVEISKSGLLTPQAAAAIAGLRKDLKAQYQSIAITADDYTSAPEKGRPVDLYPTDSEAAMMDGAVLEEAPPHDDGDAPLPFA